MRPCVGEIARYRVGGTRGREGADHWRRIGISYVFSPERDYLCGQQWRKGRGTIACSPVNRNSKAACLPHGGLNCRL